MPEWSNGADSKSVVRLAVPGVRIPLSPPPFQLNKALAIVTGAGSGIGRACALALGRRGFAVAAIDLDEKSAQETASQIPGARGYRADVSVAAQVDAALNAAVADLGPLEVLVNNAGILD